VNRPPKEKKHFAVYAKSETKHCTVVLTEYRFEAVDGKIHAYRQRNVKLLGVTKTYHLCFQKQTSTYSFVIFI